MASVKRFMVWTYKSKRDKEPKFHASLITNPDFTLCNKVAMNIMERVDGEFQTPPVIVNCFTCRDRMKKYWPVKGAYFSPE